MLSTLRNGLRPEPRLVKRPGRDAGVGRRRLLRLRLPGTQVELDGRTCARWSTSTSQ